MFVATLSAVTLVMNALGGGGVEKPISAAGPNGLLAGTELTTGSPSTVVLIVPGSGPTDRDGNSPLGLKASTYKLLAEGLAERGIATVRIDKRGMFGSAGAIPDPNGVTIEDYADDVHSWIDVIRKTTGVNCVWVLGHSEGGLVALAATQHPDGICGIILVSTAGRSLGTLLRKQLSANPANSAILADADKAITSLEAGDRVDVTNLHPALQRLFAPQVQGFLISAMAMRPTDLIQRYSGPALIVQGDADLQVSIDDANLLKAADAKAKLAILPNVNHVLKQATATDRAANFATYTDPSLPLGPGVVEAIVNFVNSRH